MKQKYLQKNDIYRVGKTYEKVEYIWYRIVNKLLIFNYRINRLLSLTIGTTYTSKAKNNLKKREQIFTKV